MKRSVLTIAALLLACALLAGCGSQSINGMVGGSDMGYSVEAPAAEAQESYDASLTDESLGESLMDPADTGDRKIVYTADLDLETRDFPTARQALLDALEKAGGYVENSSQGGSAERGNRWLSLTLRVPADQYRAFLTDAAGAGNLTRQEESQEDITIPYVDVEARLESLETQRARLEELLAQAENLTDLLEIENQLSNVEYQIASYQAQLRVMENQVSYCTVEVYLDEVDSLTILEPTFGERIGEAFTNSWADFGDFCQDFAVGFVYWLPGLLVLAAIVAAAVLIGRRARRRMRAAAAQRPPMAPPVSGADYGPLYKRPEPPKEEPKE